jgi:hypothetical protein
MFVEIYQWYVDNRETALRGSASASQHQSAVKERALTVLRWLL